MEKPNLTTTKPCVGLCHLRFNKTLMLSVHHHTLDNIAEGCKKWKLMHPFRGCKINGNRCENLNNPTSNNDPMHPEQGLRWSLLPGEAGNRKEAKRGFGEVKELASIDPIIPSLWQGGGNLVFQWRI